MSEEALELGAIERRMTAVSAVRQVVHALWALSRAQLPLVEQVAAQAHTWVDWVDEVVERLAGRPAPRVAQPTLHVVLGPERAYVGPLARHVLAAVPREGSVGLVGRRLAEAAIGDANLEGRLQFALPGASTHDEHELVARAVAEAVLSYAPERHVVLHYPRMGRDELTRVVLLAAAREPAPLPPDTYSPVTVVLDQALREALTGRLAVGVIEALQAEVAARIAAAEQARSACDKRLDELADEWRAARQERITNELLEITAGRQVLEARQRRGAPG